jgi:PhzF family phenazine biosynthesis protein
MFAGASGGAQPQEGLHKAGHSAAGNEAAVAAAAAAEEEEEEQAAQEEVCSRFFAPWMGINEDPVTGSAHAVLGPYWEPLLRPAGVAGAGLDQGSACGPMRMRQCSARGGDLLVEVLRSEGRVVVSGTATLVLEGTLQV